MWESEVPLGIISGPIKGASACSPEGRSVAAQRKRFRNTEHGGAHVRDGAGSVWVVNEFLNETRRFVRARKRKIVETSQIKISAFKVAMWKIFKKNELRYRGKVTEFLSLADQTMLVIF